MNSLARENLDLNMMEFDRVIIVGLSWENAPSESSKMANFNLLNSTYLSEYSCSEDETFTGTSARSVSSFPRTIQNPRTSVAKMSEKKPSKSQIFGEQKNEDDGDVLGF